MAVAAARTTNPLLLGLIGAVVAFVVAARRSSAPWSRSLAVFLRIGIVVIAIRIVVQIAFGERLPGHVLFTLPHVDLPSWAAGVSIGGPVTIEAVLQAFCEGLRLAVILLCFGAANSLASPYRLLRCLPAILYEAGVAVTVALSFVPEVVLSLTSIREARRLRGRPTRGVAGIRGLAVPVLEGALDRSLQLAASMDARGYGRRSPLARRARRLATATTAGGLLLALAGVYGVLDAGAGAGLGVPALAVGMALLATGMAVNGRRTIRTRYRPDVWRGREWEVTLCGLVAPATFVAAGVLGLAGLQLNFFPLEAPTLPALPCLGVFVGLLPAVIAPRPQPLVAPAPSAAVPAEPPSAAVPAEPPSAALGRARPPEPTGTAEGAA